MNENQNQQQTMNDWLLLIVPLLRKIWCHPYISRNKIFINSFMQLYLCSDCLFLLKKQRKVMLQYGQTFQYYTLVSQDLRTFPLNQLCFRQLKFRTGQYLAFNLVPPKLSEEGKPRPSLYFSCCYAPQVVREQMHKMHTDRCIAFLVNLRHP